MRNQYKELSGSQRRNMLVEAAVRVLEEDGLAPGRLPGRGRSNSWMIEEDGQQKRVAIRTTQDRWLAFTLLDKGTKWKTLDDVDVVVVATVDIPDNPRHVEVYRFHAKEVRRRFDQAYTARRKAGHVLQDNYGVWVCLDADDRGIAASAGAGLAEAYPRIARFSLEELPGQDGTKLEAAAQGRKAAGIAGLREAHSFAEILDQARERIADFLGIGVEAVRLDCRIER